ncbi:MAG: hypothetical protein EOP05_00510 [Proteobacteria bacterium]|nr:MAG: hypothetical protein EOP05_00510 [Pseudomonadota bacterium]
MNAVNEKWKVALESKLKLALSETTLSDNGERIDVSDLWGRLKPAIEQIVSRFGHILDSDEASIQIIDVALREIYRTADTDPEKPQTSQEIGAEIVERMSREASQYFAALPNKYDVFFELPGLKDADCTNFSLTSKVKAVECFGLANKVGSKRNVSIYEVIGALNGKRTEDETFIIQSGLYLKTFVEGHIGHRSDGITAFEAISRVKQTIFLLKLANRIEFANPIGGAIPAKVYVRFGKDIRELDVAEDFAELLGKVTLTKEVRKVVGEERSNWKGGAHGATTILTTPPVPQQYLRLPRASSDLIDLPDNHSDSIALKNAMIWAMDAQQGRGDISLKLVQLSIAFEAVLGIDSTKQGKTEQLADRCAYVVANTRSERAEIRRQFVKFYNVRSEIVHGSKTRADSEVRVMYFWAKRVLQIVIAKEIAPRMDSVTSTVKR